MITENNTKNIIKKSTWLITAKTNLHVGDESGMGYGLVDKTVQRDALLHFPCINSSSLKGALNEYCCHNQTTLLPEEIYKIFGSDKKDKSKDSVKGNTLFFDAGILFIPIQDDNELYKLAYCDKIINSFLDKAKLFGLPLEKEDLFKLLNNKEKEVSYDEFKNLCKENELPIIARNVLDNGESKNLWYEEIVPAETIFYTFMQSPAEKLESAIDGHIIQVGANATIGYGYCQFTKIPKDEKK